MREKINYLRKYLLDSSAMGRTVQVLLNVSM